MGNLNDYLENLHRKNILLNTSQSDVDKVTSIYPVKISDHILNRILEANSEALARQFFPNPEELEDTTGVGAFFPDEKHASKTLVQKYPNRCIIYTTSSCFANCRHCSRKEKWKEQYTFSRVEFDEAYLKIKDASFFEEVILTGGDMLTIDDESIDYVLNKITSISHVKVVRIGTRAFTSYPKRISSKLCTILSKYKSVVILTQFNHPDEFSEDTINAIQMVQKTGTPILNQAVLLKDINDRYSVIKELLTKCAENRVIPYYLFHCFKVKGVQCFRPDVKVGIKIMQNLVGNVGGWWIPRYILIPHTTGLKIPVCPNGIVEETNGALLVKDYTDRICKYE